jgi:inner membrane protein
MWKNARLMAKMAVIGVLTLLLLIPLGMILGLISERQSYKQEVIENLAQSWAKDQTVTGPYLVIRYWVKGMEKEWDPNLKEYTRKEIKRERLCILPPEKLAVEADLPVELRYRGIYRVPVYTAATRFQASFAVPERFGNISGEEIVAWDSPRLVVGVGDVRGIASVPNLKGMDKVLGFEPGTEIPGGGPGISAVLPPMAPDQSRTFDLAFDLNLLGMNSFSLVPLGRDSSLSIRSNWPHPGFSGRFPAAETSVGAGGFTVNWQLSHFATNLPDYFREGDLKLSSLGGLAVGAKLVDPVDIYTQTERATKYGVLFIALTFAAFFLHEVLKDLSIHPVQYCLVGGALALFFLLVVAFSEHVAFGLAYAIAASSCVGLIGFYLCYVLKSAVRGTVFTGMLAFLYGVLYMLLQSEDYALLMGSLLLFAGLAVVMVLTRRINWYALEKGGPVPPPMPTAS